MDNLINKVTLYDIISVIIPGSITLIAFFNVSSEINAIIVGLVTWLDNSWFVFGLFIICSYSVGWTLSQLMSIFYELLESIKKCISKFKVKSILKYLAIFIFPVLIFVQVLLILEKCICENVWFMFLVFVVFVIGCYGVEKKGWEDEFEFRLLLLECYSYLEQYYKNFSSQINNDSKLSAKDDENEKKYSAVMAMSKSSLFLIQTDSKYVRIHNYNSSKSFSKNLAGVCLILACVFCFNYCQVDKSPWNYIYSILIFIMEFGFCILSVRYRKFEYKVNLLTLTYFVDFLRNKSDKDCDKLPIINFKI